MRRQKRPLGLFSVGVVLAVALAGRAAVGCNSVDVIPVAECKPGAVCTCQEDPNQPLCKGFNDRGDSGRIDAEIFFDAAPPEDAPADAPEEAPDDAGDEAG